MSKPLAILLTLLIAQPAFAVGVLILGLMGDDEEARHTARTEHPEIEREWASLEAAIGRLTDLNPAGLMKLTDEKALDKLARPVGLPECVSLNTFGMKEQYAVAIGDFAVVQILPAAGRNNVVLCLRKSTDFVALKADDAESTAQRLAWERTFVPKIRAWIDEQRKIAAVWQFESRYKELDRSDLGNVRR